MTAADPALPIVEAHEAIMVVAEGPMSDDARDLVMERVYELEKAMSAVRPTTMEGAVRSGYLAAEAILESLGRAEKIVVDERPRQWLARWLIWGHVSDQG